MRTVHQHQHIYVLVVRVYHAQGRSAARGEGGTARGDPCNTYMCCSLVVWEQYRPLTLPVLLLMLLLHQY